MAMVRAPLSRFALVVAAALLPVSVGGVRAATVPDTAAVLVEDYAYQPEHVSLVVGGSVTWTLGADPEQHTVTPRQPGAFDDSGHLFAGDTFTVVFDQPGSVEYFCSLHPTMVGTVTVVVAPTAAPAASGTSVASPSMAVISTPTAASASPAPSANATSSVVAPGRAAPADDPAAFALPLAAAGALAVATVVALNWIRRRRA